MNRRRENWRSRRVDERRFNLLPCILTATMDSKKRGCRGRAFFVGRSLHDDELIVKLAVVESIQRFTAEGQQGQRDEEAADRADDAPMSFT